MKKSKFFDFSSDKNRLQDTAFILYCNIFDYYLKKKDIFHFTGTVYVMPAFVTVSGIISF